GGGHYSTCCPLPYRVAAPLPPPQVAPSTSRRGVADYVRDGLLRNLEGSYLHRRWQRWEALGCFEVYPELCYSAALDLLMHRVHQTQLVQSGRAELVDEPAHIGERHSEIGARLGHQCVRCRV